MRMKRRRNKLKLKEIEEIEKEQCPYCGFDLRNGIIFPPLEGYKSYVCLNIKCSHYHNYFKIRRQRCLYREHVVCEDHSGCQGRRCFQQTLAEIDKIKELERNNLSA